MKLRVVTFNHEAFAQATTEVKRWEDLGKEITNQAPPEADSFEILRQEKKYYVIRWNTGIVEHCTIRFFNKYKKKYKFS